MISNKKSNRLRTLLVTASAGLLMGNMAYFVPDANAETGRGGGGVGDSSESGKAQPSFRDRLKSSVESLAAALRDGKPWDTFVWDHETEPDDVDTASLTI